MSWSFHAIGKPAAVAEKTKAALGNYKLAEPEETIKSKVIDIVGTALAAYPEASAVSVEAYGSQSSGADGITNDLKIEIKHLYGFVE